MSDDLDLIPPHFSDPCSRRLCAICIDLGCNCPCHHAPCGGNVPSASLDLPKADIEITVRRRPDNLYEVSFAPCTCTIVVNDEKRRTTVEGLSSVGDDVEAALQQAANMFFTYMIGPLLSGASEVMKNAK